MIVYKFRSLISNFAFSLIVLLIIESIPLNKNSGNIDFLFDNSKAIYFRLEKALIILYIYIFILKYIKINNFNYLSNIIP